MHSPEAGARFLAAFEQALYRLATSPLVGSLMPTEEKLAGLRKWPIPEFPNRLLYYIPRDEFVEVLWLLHGAQDRERVFGTE